MTNSREKGKRGERELAATLRELGVEARRGVQHKGGPDSPDVVAELRGVHLECKRVERFNAYEALQQASDEAPAGAIPVVAHRRSAPRGRPALPWVAVLTLEDLVQLLMEAGRA